VVLEYLLQVILGSGQPTHYSLSTLREVEVHGYEVLVVVTPSCSFSGSMVPLIYVFAHILIVKEFALFAFDNGFLCGRFFDFFSHRFLFKLSLLLLDVLCRALSVFIDSNLFRALGLVEGVVFLTSLCGRSNSQRPSKHDK
jgi:hypothetical protein